MAEAHDTGYLSIGEVLGLLLEDFPDVTISKIRFLESQGLISPERTASGYRKFYDADVDLLRVILTEQRSNYLPLRVIKDRLDSGEIDPTGERDRPDGVADTDDRLDDDGDDEISDEDVPSEAMSKHPAARNAAGNGASAATSTPKHESVDDTTTETAAASTDSSDSTDAPTGEPPAATKQAGKTSAKKKPKKQPADAQLVPGVLLDRGELCAMVGMTDRELEQLESFGIVVSRDGATPGLYGDDAVEVAKPACELLRAGVDARHLRTYRTSAEREVSLYEQLVTPRMRQRNPESRAEALDELRRLDELGADLRASMTRQALRRHFES